MVLFSNSLSTSTLLNLEISNYIGPSVHLKMIFSFRVEIAQIGSSSTPTLLVTKFTTL